MALIKKVKSERFAALNASVTWGGFVRPFVHLTGDLNMDNIKLYNVNNRYIDYLLPHAPHLFKNKKPEQQNERKYIGIVLHINNVDYFATLSSFKPKHAAMKETTDFIKVKNYAVINLNNMFPVPNSEYMYVNIAKERNPQYRALLQAEYRFIKSIQGKIKKNALTIYKHKIANGTSTGLAKRCNDFSKLEQLCKVYGK